MPSQVKCSTRHASYVQGASVRVGHGMRVCIGVQVAWTLPMHRVCHEECYANGEWGMERVTGYQRRVTDGGGAGVCHSEN